MASIRPVDARSYVSVNDYEKLELEFPEISTLGLDIIGTPSDSPDPNQLQMNYPEVTPEQAYLECLLDEFADTFSKHEYDLGLAHMFEAELPTNDHPPYSD